MTTYLLFFSLCLLEVVLGLDNIFSFSMLINQAPEDQRRFAKIVALAGAFILRLGFLALALAIQDLSWPFMVFGYTWSVKKAFLFFGGIFLSCKAIKELRHVAKPLDHAKTSARPSLNWIIAEIIFIDMVFAIDSVLVAIAMTQNAYMIASSILCSIISMYFAADWVIRHMAKSWRFNILGMLLILIIGIFLMLKGVGFIPDHKIVLTMILFGCGYEALMSSIEYKRSQQGL